MKIYFSAAIYRIEEFGSDYQKIIDFFQKRGHLVQSEHIISNKLEEIRKQSLEENKKFYKKASRWMQESNLVVIEASFPSSVNIGHEITTALNKKKPVIVLYKPGLKPQMLLGVEDDNLLCVEYTSETIETLLEDALEYITDQMDVRFNLFLSAKINQYLSKVSKEEQTSKSQFIRNLIRQHMKESAAAFKLAEASPSQKP